MPALLRPWPASPGWLHAEDGAVNQLAGKGAGETCDFG